MELTKIQNTCEVQRPQCVVPISCIASHNPTKPPAGPWGDADLESWFKARHGAARHGEARHGSWQGMARLGSARRGKARHGSWVVAVRYTY